MIVLKKLVREVTREGWMFLSLIEYTNKILKLKLSGAEMWLQAFCSLLILQGPLHDWKPFPVPCRKFSVYPTVPVEIILGLPCNLFFGIRVMASVILHRRRLFFFPGCKEKITVFVILSNQSCLCVPPKFIV